MSPRAVFLLCLILLTGCSLPGAVAPSPVALEATSSPVEFPVSTPLEQPTATSPLAETPAPTSANAVSATGKHYTLQAIFDYLGHTLAVSETVEYTNNSPDALSELQLAVEANRWEGSFVLESLTWGGGEAVSNYELESNRLLIPLPQPLQPGDSLALLMAYTLNLPAIPVSTESIRPLPYGYTARQTNLVDWYPFVAPYRSGQGWLLHAAGTFGEHQVYDVADYDVEISLHQPVEGLVIAASAPAETSGSAYRYHLAGARNFVWSASHLYTVRSMQVGDVMVTSYFFPGEARAGEQVLLDSGEALRLYSRLFSPYPYPSLSVVEADFPDGMEYNSLFFLSNSFYTLYDGTPQGYLTIITAHETAHQWWYSLVGSDQALEPWLDEAMCTYSERIFYEYIYPDLLDWWWAFRIDPYQPSGIIDGSIYDYGNMRTYRDSVYLHGAQFLEQLRLGAGDQAFFAFLQDYAARLSNQQTTTTDFFAIFQEHSGMELDVLLDDYFSSVHK